MKKLRLKFLTYALHNLSDDVLRIIANEYTSAHDDITIYENNDWGLDDCCCGMSVDEILRASCYGNYTYTDSFVFINSHGNLESTNEISCVVDVHEIADWMIDGGYQCCFDAWDTLNNSTYCEQGCYEDDFADEISYYVLTNECDDDIREWVEYCGYTLSHLLLTSWEDLKDDYYIWKSEKDLEYEKTLKRCGLD